MVHIPFQYDFWEKETSNEKFDGRVEVSVLMPNGILIVLETNIYVTLHEIKMDVWDEASSPNKNYPFVHLLQDKSMYMFSCVSAIGEAQDLRDETLRLCDARPFFCILKLIWKGEEDSEKEINCQISNLLGRGIHEFAALHNSEVDDFRTRMKHLGAEVAMDRRGKTRRERLAYHFPPRLAATPNIPVNCRSRLKENTYLFLWARFENLESAWKLNISCNITLTQLITMILAKKSLTYEGSRSNSDRRPDGYVLKVCGREEYLLEEVPIIQFLYIQESLSRDVEPSLVLCSVESISLLEMDSIYMDLGELGPMNPQFSTMTIRRNKTKTISSWAVEDLFSFTVDTIFRLNTVDSIADTEDTRSVEIGLMAGLYHGGKPLCETQKTREYLARKDAIDMNEELTFEIQVCNIPRMARLCIAVYEISKSASKGFKTKKIKDSKQEKDVYITPLAWVNTPVYDFRGQIKCGQYTFNMWTYAENTVSDEIIQVLGTVMANSSTVDYGTALTLSFKRYHQDAGILYPSLEKMLQCAADYSSEMPLSKKSQSDVEAYLDGVRQMNERDPLHDLHEQDKKELWAARYDVQRYVPSLLSKLLESVDWNDHKQVAEANSLVVNWKLLPVERALELLDYAYAEQQVRSFAVKCLERVPDEELSLYLLQLVQAIKHESYLCCDLVEFILKRALNNRKIGHFLFWHLRSEMSYAPVSTRFGLIIEAYCRGSLEHIGVLTKQLEYLRKMKETSEKLKLHKDREKAKDFMLDCFRDQHSAAVMSDVINPLDPRYRLKGVRVDECRVMDSKMRPLWLVMQNYDPQGENVYIIFKNGDDLRQDMLALQMIKIMDMLWKNQGLDLRMNPYGCISTDRRTGLIEVVLNADTIANIQKEKGMFTATSAFSKGSILAWLKDHNSGDNLLKAIDEFSLSCAGYCVATYVLGVADRHSDNIMIKRSGQLFHIDYGHILGHFKEKFGFKRERVPFVLTHDFVHVINNGRKDRRLDEFVRFQDNCETAFKILRRHGSLILSLFAMMICTGLPELSNESDLNYLRDTLVLDMTEQDAVEHFRAKFNEALANSWKTSLNWASHNIAKNNKT